MAFDVEQLGLDDGTVLGKLLRKRYVQMVRLAYADAADLLEVDLAFDLENEQVQEVLDDLATEVKRIAETTREEIRSLIGRQAREGWSTSELADEIAKLAEVHSTNRASLIAINETALAYTKGSLLAYEESGVVEAIEWVATMDERTTERCRALNGTTVKLGETWDGDMPPRFPGCRCAIAPVVEA